MRSTGTCSTCGRCITLVYLILTINILLAGGNACEQNVEVVTFNITCDPNSNKTEYEAQECDSETLANIAASVKEQNLSKVHIDIKISRLELNDTVTFTNLTSLTISGQTDSTTNIVCISSDCPHGTGIVLNNITEKVTLKNLNVSFCGSKISITNRSEIFSSALSIIHSSDVELHGIVLMRNKGIGLVISGRQGGYTSIKSTVIKENRLPHNYSFASIVAENVRGGGGVYILLEKPSLTSYSPTMFEFIDCTFENNTSNVSHYKYSYTDILGTVREGYGRGGGMFMYINNGLSNVSVLFFQCKFIANQAFLGAGLSVKIYGQNVEKVEGISVALEDSLFGLNGCHRDRSKTAGFGGGAHLTLHSYLNQPIITNSHYLIKNVTFRGNCAELGGGVYHYSTRQSFRHSNMNYNSMVFEDSVFEGNKAHIGSALIMVPDNRRRLSTGHSVTIMFINCLVFNNIVFDNSPLDFGQRTSGVGTVYISLYDIYFQGYTLFENNYGSCLHLVNGIVDFSMTSASFINNTALQGGALALIGSSRIILGENCYEFINNSAKYRGGAVYVSQIDTLDFVGSMDCFIQYTHGEKLLLTAEWNASVTFIGNRAEDSTAGNAIYVTSLHSCQLIKSNFSIPSKYELLNMDEVFTRRGFKFDNSVSQVATDGALLNKTQMSPLMIIPGEKYIHGVKAIDDLDKEVSASFWATIPDSEKSSDVSLSSTSSTLIRNKIKVSGKPSNHTKINLNIVSARQSFIQLDVVLLDCPPGFFLKDNSRCTCNTDAYVGILQCDFDKFQSYLLKGYWAGFIDTSDGPTLVTSVCAFCKYASDKSNTFLIALPRMSSELDRAICGETRTGVICGRCRENYTVHFHSPGYLCKPAEPFGCKLGWLFYILSELVPVTIFFVIVLVLNIQFTSGSINGFILFAQLLSTLNLDASGIIVVPGATMDAVKYIMQVSQILYGIFNLDFFSSDSLSFCLWKSATALDMLAFKYVTVFYTIVLVITVIWTMNRYQGKWCFKCCRITTLKKSVVHGISTFLVLGYSQCVNVSLSLLIQVHIFAAENSHFSLNPRVLLNGELEYFGREHLRYAIPALLCLFSIGLFPPAFLLTYPLINKTVNAVGLDEHKLAIFLTHVPFNSYLKPVLDSFQGCFKDNFRFFAGLYFLYRWIFLFVDISTDTLSSYFTAVGAILVFILTLHMICQPYAKRVHNITDTLLLSNIVVINSLSFFNYHRSKNLPSSIRATAAPTILQLLLICLPLLVLAIYVFFNFCKWVCVTHYGCRQQIGNTTTISKNLKDIIILITSSNNKRSDTGEIEVSQNHLLDEDIEYRRKCDYTD